MPIGHPREVTLHRFEDGELTGLRREHVAAHLEACARCRALVLSIRSLSEAAGGLHPVGPPDGLLEAVVARRAAGDRVILPTSDPRAPRITRAAARVAAIGLLLAAGFIAVQVRDAGAHASDLRFEPERPLRGAAIAVAYTPEAALASYPTLRLRARLRDRDDESYNGGMTSTVLATLERDDDGEYRGEFTLPDSIVFAAFAVEAPDGSVVDANDRRLWELVIHDEGRPLAAALEQRSNDLMGRNWELAFESARELARLYPDEPRSLSLVSFFEPLVMGEQAWADSGLAAFQDRFARLDAKLRGRTGLDGDQLAATMWSARRAEDSTREAHWRERLLVAFPRHTQTLQHRIIHEILMPHYADTAYVIARLDSIWGTVDDEPVRTGPGYGHLLGQGLGFAAGTGDAELAGLWADRYLEVWPTGRVNGARAIAPIPALRPRAITLLEGELARLESPSDDDRPLHLTVEENLRRLERPIQSVLATLGNTLIDAGETERGAATLARAAAIGWDTGMFRRIAEAQLELGRADAALSTFARVAADPATTPAFADSIRDRLGSAYDEAVWQDRVEAARTAMHDRTLEDATMRSLPDPVRLKTRDGQTRTLRDIAAGRVAFVTMWDRYCGAAIEALPEIERLANELEARGIAAIVIAEQPPSPELDAFLREKNVEITLYHDTRREAIRAFNAWGTPEYFITDADGRIRFEYTDLSSALRQVAALERERPLTP